MPGTIIKKPAKETAEVKPNTTSPRGHFYTTTPEISTIRKLAIDIAKQQHTLLSASTFGKKEKISETTRKKQLENDALEQDINLKTFTLRILFYFLALETTVVFAFAFLQATRWWNFHLEEWSFRLLISATILQITYMLRFAVKHLFPENKFK